MKLPGYLVTGSQPICGSPVLIKLDQAVVNILEAWRSAALKHTQISCMWVNRENWMIYRGPGSLAVVWFGSTPTPSPVSKLPLFLSLPMCRRSSLLTEEGRGWMWRRIIQPQESLALYKSFYNLWWVTDLKIWHTLTCHSPWFTLLSLMWLLRIDADN